MSENEVQTTPEPTSDVTSVAEEQPATAEPAVTITEPVIVAPDDRLEFIEKFVGSLSEQERRDFVRQLSKGVFIDSAIADRIVEARGKWLSEHSQRNPGNDRLRQALFGNSDLFYLNEGKSCRVGHFIDCVCPGLQRQRVQLFRGSLQSVARDIHPRDPMLSSIEGVKAELSDSGFKLEIVVRDHHVRVGERELRQFFDLLVNSRAVARAMKREVVGLRDALPVLVHLLRRAREVRQNSKLLIPARFRKDSGAIFLRAGSIILVLDQNLALAWSYDLRGKNLHYFLTSEYAQLARGGKKTPIRGFEMDRQARHILGRFTVQQIVYPLLPIAFKEFILLAPRSASLAEFFPKRYTVFDCLKIFNDEIQQSHRIEAWNLERAQALKAPKGSRFLASKGWVFILNQRNAIEQIGIRWRKRANETEVPKVEVL